MSSDLIKITARLKGIAIVEDVTAQVGYHAMRLTFPDGEQRTEHAKSSTGWNEMVANVRRNHERGYCIYVDYDKLL